MRIASLALLLLLAGCSPLPVTGNLTAFEARLLDTIPAGSNVVVPVAYGREGQSAAYVARTPAGDFAVCGDWRGKTYTVI